MGKIPLKNLFVSSPSSIWLKILKNELKPGMSQPKVWSIPSQRSSICKSLPQLELGLQFCYVNSQMKHCKNCETSLSSGIFQVFQIILVFQVF